MPENTQVKTKANPSFGPSLLDNEGTPNTAPALPGRANGPREGVALTRDLSQPPLSGIATLGITIGDTLPTEVARSLALHSRSCRQATQPAPQRGLISRAGQGDDAFPGNQQHLTNQNPERLPSSGL